MKIYEALNFFKNKHKVPEFFEGSRKIISLKPLKTSVVPQPSSTPSMSAAPLSIKLKANLYVRIYISWTRLDGGSVPCNGDKMTIGKAFTKGFDKTRSSSIESSISSELGIKDVATIGSSLTAMIGYAITLKHSTVKKREVTITPPKQGTKSINLYLPTIEYQFSNMAHFPNILFKMTNNIDYVLQRATKSPKPSCKDHALLVPESTNEFLATISDIYNHFPDSNVFASDDPLVLLEYLDYSQESLAYMGIPNEKSAPLFDEIYAAIDAHVSRLFELDN